MFIAIEGIDGVGKTTLCNHLYNRILEWGIPVIAVREPGSTPAGEVIRTAIMSDQLKQAHTPLTEALLFTAARADLFHGIIKPSLDEGKIVLCDRFVASTWAYQHWGHGTDATALTFMQYAAIGRFVPDLTLFLYTEQLDEVLARKKGENRFDESALDYMRKVDAGYHQMYRMSWRYDLWGVGEEWMGFRVDRPLEEALRNAEDYVAVAIGA